MSFYHRNIKKGLFVDFFMECEICGVRDVQLFDAVSRGGLIKVCHKCAIRENLNIIKKVDSLKIKESEKNQSVYEKLSRMAGVDPKEHKARIVGPKDKKVNELSHPELKTLSTDFKDDLIRNYHWAIFKARRAMKLSQKQLADAISEKEESVKYIERGVLPENYHEFVKKIETYLGITLFKTSPIQKKPVEIVEEVEEVEETPRLSFFAAWRERRKKRRDERRASKIVDEDIDLSGESIEEEPSLTQEELDGIFFENK